MSRPASFCGSAFLTALSELPNLPAPRFAPASSPGPWPAPHSLRRRTRAETRRALAAPQTVRGVHIPTDIVPAAVC